MIMFWQLRLQLLNARVKGSDQSISERQKEAKVGKDEESQDDQFTVYQ